MVQQSFDIFNVYGKDPEAGKNILRAFLAVLEPFRIECISSAFKEWMEGQSTMPTPSDIRRMAERNQADADKIARAFKPVPAVTSSVRTVPWASMTYKQCQKAGLIDHIRAHCEDLKGKQDDYLKYLNRHWGFPKMLQDWQ